MKEMLKRIDPVRWQLSSKAQACMRVPGLIYGDSYILEHLEKENALQQVANVACLPGIVGHSFAMPDVHWGYGFPIGGVAAFDVKDGIISPGGVGYDISCGVRLMPVHNLDIEEVRSKADALAAALFSAVPCGVGSRGAISLSDKDLKDVLRQGARWTVRKELGEGRDLESIEEGGCLAGADPEAVSERARKRGHDQLGTLGSGNHFMEIQMVDELYDPAVVRAFDLHAGQVAVMVHCGSRGLGHQVCDDYIKVMARAMTKYGLSVPDRQLCCAPISSPEGQRYLTAMKAAANFALANREAIGQRIREVFRHFFPRSRLDLLYDVSHNMAHMERWKYEGVERDLCVHRKGATRALPPGHGGLSERYRTSGQPVIIPGSMGTCSYVLVGTKRAAEECFASTCHGAGRMMSRKAASKSADIRELNKRLAERGISVKAESHRTLREEIPEAYKNVEAVVNVVDRAGISRKVARLRPVIVIKG